MDELGLGIGLGFTALFLVVHCASVAFAQGLRTYSRSRLEELCEESAIAPWADDIARNDEDTDRAAGILAVLSTAGLAVVLGLITASSKWDAFDGLIVSIGVLLAGLLHLFAGVIGRVFAERVILTLWPIARLVRLFATPFTLISDTVEQQIAKLGNGQEKTRRPASVEVEIHTNDEDDEEEVEADLPEPTRDMLERVVELSRRDVSEIMTPRSTMIAIPATASCAEAAKAFRESGRSRIPLYGETRDDITGILYEKDLFAKISMGDTQVEITSLMREPYFIPETKSAPALLEEFRGLRVQMAIVLDEYGGVVGLITLEDLLEELVGTIDDEHDTPTPDNLKQLSETRYELDAAFPLEELNERLALHLPTDGDFLTVGGYAFTILGKVPEPGVSIRSHGVEFTVVEVTDHSIRRLLLDLIPADEAVEK